MNILLTGATGFIGRHLATQLASRHQIFATTRSPHTILSNLGVHEIHADLLNPIDRGCLPHVIDSVVHLAQHNGLFPLSARELFAVNTARTQELLDYAIRHGAQQFVFASSGDVYGFRQALLPFKESDTASPSSFYGVTKYCSEIVAQQYGQHLAIAILRLFTPYGPGQKGRLIPSVAERVISGKPVKIHRESRPFLTPLYIDDAIRAFVSAIEGNASGTFNISGNTVISVRGIAEAFGALFGKTPLFEETGEDVGNLIGENVLMQQALEISPNVDLNEGLKRTIAVSWR